VQFDTCRKRIGRSSRGRAASRPARKLNPITEAMLSSRLLIERIIDMGDALSRPAIVSAVAQAAAQRITRKAIRTLQGIKEKLSGDDSELKTTWDEICVQVQGEESIFWDSYDETARSIVTGCVSELPKHEREAIWLQTDAGIDWDCEKPEDRETYPVVHQDVVEYLVCKYIYAAAADWSNARIETYKARSSMRDGFEL
jgi:hypothetical protein